MSVTSKGVLSFHSQPTRAELVELARDDDAPRAGYMIGIPLPQELKDRTKERIEQAIEGLRMIADAGQWEERVADVTEEMYAQAEDDLPDHIVMGEPFTLCWN